MISRRVTITLPAKPKFNAPCPGLKLAKDGTRTICKFVEAEIQGGHAPYLQATLGIGMGCTMSDEDTTKEEAERQQEEMSLECLKRWPAVMAEMMTTP